MRGFISMAAVAALFSFLPLMPGAGARAEDMGGGERHCPHNPGSTHQFFHREVMDRDKDRLEDLGTMIAQHKTPVCILALIDSHDPAYSKKLAIRRVSWVIDTLTGQGVPRDSIAVELKMAPPEQEKSTISIVSVILGN